MFDWTLPLRRLSRSVDEQHWPLVKFAIVIVALTILFVPALAKHAANASDELRFNDDSRMQIWPFLRYHDPALFQDDALAQYHLDCMPVGYKLLYRGWALIADPRVLSKLLPYLLLPVVLLGTGIAARRLGGSVAGWGAVALCLASSFFLARMAGGLPRAFGFPVIAAATAALAWGRPWMLAAITLVGAAFYPIAGLLSGICLAGWLLALPRADRAEARDWSLGRRLAVVSATALVSAVLLLPGLRGSAAWGPLIHPDEIASYPEAGPGGRFIRRDHPPYRSFTTEASFLVKQVLVGGGGAWPGITRWMRGDGPAPPLRLRLLLWTVVAAGLAGTTVLATRESAARRLLLLAAAGVVGYLAALTVAPALYIPARYADYTVPLLAIVLIPAGACALGSIAARRWPRPWVKPATSVAFIALCVLGLGTRGDSEAGLNVRINPQQRIYAYLASLPPDAMIAGWPAGLMDNVPYVCQRRILLSFETHSAFHRRYLELGRRRMAALLEAYYATEPGPLLQLHEQFGVTHLVFDLRHSLQPPSYFAPYQPAVTEAFRGTRSAGLEVLRHENDAMVYREGPYLVLDLRRLGSSENTS